MHAIDLVTLPKKTRKSQYKKKASKSTRMASYREKNHAIHKGGTSKTRRKAKKEEKYDKILKRPLKMQNKVNEKNKKIAKSDPLDTYQAE